jgi:hypothetical protein
MRKAKNRLEKREPPAPTRLPAAGGEWLWAAACCACAAAPLLCAAALCPVLHWLAANCAPSPGALRHARGEATPHHLGRAGSWKHRDCGTGGKAGGGGLYEPACCLWAAGDSGALVAGWAWRALVSSSTVAVSPHTHTHTHTPEFARGSTPICGAGP